MTPEDRANAVAAFGFTDRQARFLATVMVHTGVCLERQYCAFARIAHGRKSHAFFRRLVRDRIAASYPCVHNRARIYHIRHAPLYRAIGEGHSRNRKPAFLGRAVERLMMLDFLLTRPNLSWLATADDKLAHFITALHGRLSAKDFPRLVVRSTSGPTTRYFPDKLPIGVRAGEPPVFAYLGVSRRSGEFRAFMHRHAELFNALPEWVICLLLPLNLASAETRYRAAFWDEATTLSPATIEELRWYFAERRRAVDVPGGSSPRYNAARRAFAAPRFHPLYRAWTSQGDRLLDALHSPFLAEAVARGTGRLEVHSLPHRYRHLLPLVGTA